MFVWDASVASGNVDSEGSGDEQGSVIGKNKFDSVAIALAARRFTRIRSVVL